MEQPGSLLVAGRRQLRTIFQATETGDSGHHHSREELHGGDIFLIEGMWFRREYFEDTQGATKLSKRCHQDRTHSEMSARRQIHVAVGFSVVADQNFTCSYTIGGEADIGLQADPYVRSGTPRARPTDDLGAFAQCDRGPGRSGERDSFFGNDVDTRLEVQLTKIGSPTSRCCGCMDGSALSHTKMMSPEERVCGGESGFTLRLDGQNWHCLQKRAYKLIEFGVGDEVSGLLSTEGTAQYTRETEDGVAAAGEAVWSVIFADQFTLNAEDGHLQREKARLTRSHRASHRSHVFEQMHGKK